MARCRCRRVRAWAWIWSPRCLRAPTRWWNGAAPGWCSMFCMSRSTIPFISLSLATCFLAAAGALSAAEDYPLGPESERHADVPNGAVTKYTWTSKIYPGTEREYWIYVPAQYKPDKAACVMIFQD